MVGIALLRCIPMLAIQCLARVLGMTDVWDEQHPSVATIIAFTMDVNNNNIRYGRLIGMTPPPPRLATTGMRAYQRAFRQLISEPLFIPYIYGKVCGPAKNLEKGVITKSEFIARGATRMAKIE